MTSGVYIWSRELVLQVIVGYILEAEASDTRTFSSSGSGTYIWSPWAPNDEAREINLDWCHSWILHIESVPNIEVLTYNLLPYTSTIRQEQPSKGALMLKVKHYNLHIYSLLLKTR